MAGLESARICIDAHPQLRSEVVTDQQIQMSNAKPWYKQRIAALEQQIVLLSKALDVAHEAGELGGWEDCPVEANCTACNMWREARKLRAEAKITRG